MLLIADAGMGFGTVVMTPTVRVGYLVHDIFPYADRTLEVAREEGS